MWHHYLMLKQILYYIAVTVPLHVPEAPDIPYPTKISTNLAYNETHPPNY